ncbi:MAG: formate dehydrogenase accessory sulfurtransferase FdhD, partial [Novosphingobium sp.]|nr:formate dehydrogenase accessory sulfurtransferase FdhD [Novosphingobium sp.]
MSKAVSVFPDGKRLATAREWVPEAPIALEYNGLSYAVMMATPSDLADFAVGFALSEGLAESVGEVTDIAIAEVELGWILRSTLTGAGATAVTDRARTRVSESSCGLCGIENLEALAKPLPDVPAHEALAEEALFAAFNAMSGKQTLGEATGAAHAAAWADVEGTIHCLREDVGRHNAVDKLVGAMARDGRALAPGFVLSSARCSYEIVEKAVRAGATSLVTVSLPTSLAVDRATAAGLSL